MIAGRLQMNRRTFLVSVAAGALAGLATILAPSLQGVITLASSLFPVQGNALGGLLEGTGDGRLRQSLDGGHTWQPLANFGEGCAVTGIYEQDGLAYVQLKIQRYTFLLKSADGRTWWTADSVLAA
jgi:hypothetical protein